MLGDDGKFVQDEDVVWFDGADDQSRRRVLEGVEGLLGLVAR